MSPANPPAFNSNIFPEARGELAVLRRLKAAYQPEYNAYLTGWAIAFSVLLVTFMLIAHGVHF
jgi:hypothetical protein